MGSIVERCASIRRDDRVEGLSVRELAVDTECTGGRFDRRWRQRHGHRPVPDPIAERTSASLRRAKLHPLPSSTEKLR